MQNRTLKLVNSSHAKKNSGKNSIDGISMMNLIWLYSESRSVNLKKKLEW